MYYLDCRLINQLRLLVILIIGFLFFPFLSQAVNPLDVVINEIAWMGTKVEGIDFKNWWRYEWLELYNNNKNSISLDGWKIELYRTDLDWALELKGVIPAQGYFLIVASDKISKNYDLNYSNLGGKFRNSGQKVLLKDNQGNIIDNLDCFSYGKWFAGDNSSKQTMERKNSQSSGNNSGNWASSQNPGGTPRAKNSVAIEFPSPEEQIIEPEPELESELLPPEEGTQPESKPEKPKPIIYPSGIFFNEILPDPEGISDAEGEYIEIFNKNNFTIDLSDWKIKDTIGKPTIYTFPNGKTIGPERFLVLFWPETKITLNNLDGDNLKLIRPDDAIIDEVNYEKAIKGQSYNRTPSGWVWSTSLTPGSENIIPTQKTEEVEFVEKVRKIDINTAPLEDLMKIVHIGETRAQELISLRPFYSLNELTKIKGVSPERLEEIKKQGLAWIDPALEPPKIEKTELLEKGLAAVSEPFKEKSLGRGIPKHLSLFLIALTLAIFSGIIILVLKRKIKMDYNKNI